MHDNAVFPSWHPGDEPPEPVRIAISGAAGRIGYNLVFRIAAGALFGPSQSVTLRLLESSQRIKALHAVGMELKDCAFPLLHDLHLSADPYEAFHRVDWIILLAGQPLKFDGATRQDLLRLNGPLYAEHGQAINLAAPAARILVVAEPCNTNCLIALKEAPNVPAEHWFALNRLDRMRATSMIATKARVPVNRVNRVTVWGNHSEKIFADFHNSYIGDQPAEVVITDNAWVREVFEPTVATRNREIYSLSGSTPAATASQAILGTIRSIATPTPFQHRFGAAVISDGSYNIPKGLIFGLPLRTEDGRKWSIVNDLFLDDHALARLDESIEELRLESTIAGL